MKCRILRRLSRKIAAATLLSVIGGGSMAAGPPTITSIEGFLDENNVDQFWKLIGDNLDHIVRLKIDVPETGSNVGPSPPLNAVGGGGQLGIWKRKGSFEIDVNGGYYYGSMGAYVLDGYFLVKSGGIHQGVVSCNLMPVDEARVILSGTRIRHVNLKQK